MGNKIKMKIGNVAFRFYLATAMLIIVQINSDAQTFEINTSLVYNNFFEFQPNRGHFNSSHDSEWGYGISVGLSDINVKGKRLGLTLGYTAYGGGIMASDGSLGGGKRVISHVNKTIFSFGIYPINSEITEKLILNLGFEIATLLSEFFEGNFMSWTLGQLSSSFDIKDKYERYGKNTYFGIGGKISYKFHVHNSLIISPQYQFYLGLSNEFLEFPQKTNSMRHYLGLGLKFRFD